MSTTVGRISTTSDRWLRQVSMMYSKPLIVSAVAAALLSISLYSADTSAHPHHDSSVVHAGAAPDNRGSGEEKSKAQPDSVQICKQQAQELSGPERSTFFTKCLKDSRKTGGGKGST